MIAATAFASNGTVAAVGDVSGVVAIYDVSSGLRLREISLPDDVASVSFSPDSSSIVAGSRRGDVLQWDVQTQRVLRAYKGHTGRVSQINFSNDGRWLLTVSHADASARVWDVQTGKAQRVLGGSNAPIRCAALSPDGVWVAAGATSGKLGLQRVASSDRTAWLSAHASEVVSIAFSSDSKRLATASLDDDPSAILWDVASSKPARTLAHKGGIQTLTFSADGINVFAGSSDKTLRLWKIASGRDAPMPSGQDEPVESVAITPDSQADVIQGNTTLRVIDFAQPQVTETELRAQSDSPGRIPMITAYAIAADSQRLLIGFSNGATWLFNRATGSYVEPFGGGVASVGSLAFSPGNRLLVTGNEDTTATLWDLKLGSVRYRLEPEGKAAHARSKSWLASVGFSSNGQRVLGSGHHAAYLWDVGTGKEVRRFEAEGRAALSPDGEFVATGAEEAIALWDLESGALKRKIGSYPEGLQSVSVSADSLRVIAGDYEHAIARIWDVNTGEQTLGLETDSDSADAVSFSPVDDDLVATASRHGVVQLWDTKNPAEPRWSAEHRPGVSSVAFAADGQTVLGVGANSSTRVWQVATGEESQSFDGPSGRVTAAAAASNNRWLATADVAGNTILWDEVSGRELIRLISFRDRGWAAITPDGRFDAAQLDSLPSLAWVMPDDPMHAQPVEIFMRDYYEPQLLRRVLEGETLPPIRDLATLNRLQPRVQVEQIDLEPDHESVTLLVSAENTGVEPGVTSGMFDLHLFRDKQLVGHIKGDLQSSAREPKMKFRFSRIRIPRLEGPNAVEFSAYAFNRDGVKSLTALKTFILPNALPTRRGRAYVITLGIDDFSNAAWHLNYAAEDARLVGRTLELRLEASKQFDEVVWIPLIADSRDRRAAGARKALLRATMDKLAGQDVVPELLKHVPKAAQIHRATPEDLVVLSFATHGYSDPQGLFYLFPEDIGSTSSDRQLTRTILERTISSEELAEWLELIDAGEIALIIDTCQSAAAVEGSGHFKPGPLGNRGFGQLAYNKGMRVLAASQASESARESRRLGHGLLTYALISDGLDKGLADDAPRDGRVSLHEWMAFAAHRVAALASDTATDTQSIVQQPAFFDFARKGSHSSIPVEHRGTEQEGGSNELGL